MVYCCILWEIEFPDKVLVLVWDESSFNCTCLPTWTNCHLGTRCGHWWHLCHLPVKGLHPRSRRIVDVWLVVPYLGLRSHVFNVSACFYVLVRLFGHYNIVNIPDLSGVHLITCIRKEIMLASVWVYHGMCITWVVANLICFPCSINEVSHDTTNVLVASKRVVCGNHGQQLQHFRWQTKKCAENQLEYAWRTKFSTSFSNVEFAF